MKIVKFKDGTYGVRKFSFLMGYSYVDLTTPHYDWNRYCQYYHNCKGSKEESDKVFERLTDKGSVVKE